MNNRKASGTTKAITFKLGQSCGNSHRNRILKCDADTSEKTLRTCYKYSGNINRK